MDRLALCPEEERNLKSAIFAGNARRLIGL
jgi:hypothetical protein